MSVLVLFGIIVFMGNVPSSVENPDLARAEFFVG
jgi:hypothetical protein